jgi:hypothetical protein
MKRVEAKQLTDVIHVLKLKLQEQEITSQDIAQLFFQPFDADELVELKELKLKFESLGVKAPKS